MKQLFISLWRAVENQKKLDKISELVSGCQPIGREGLIQKILNPIKPIHFGK